MNALPGNITIISVASIVPIIYFSKQIMSEVISYVFSIKVDTGYPHDGRADNAAYRHHRRVDKRRYPHDRKIDIHMLKMFRNGYILSC